MTLELRDASYRIGGKTLLDRVTIAVPAGKITIVLGPNGAGKSTALGILAGDLRPSSGEALLDGVPLARLGHQRLAKRRAVLTQSQSIEFPLTAYEIVALGLLPHHWSEAERLQALAESFAAADVAHLAARSYPTLSGGEKQRVQLARTLAQIWRPSGHGARQGDVRYLLLDEPTASLDLKHQVSILDRCRDLAQAGLGVLCVLHDPGLARRYANFAVLMSGGRVLTCGAAETVLLPDAIAATFDIDEGHARAALAMDTNWKLPAAPRTEFGHLRNG
jgi:iron complex transport system ATP-binding protein